MNLLSRITIIRCVGLACSALAIVLFPSISTSEEPQSVLVQLSEECTKTYKNVQSGIVRLQMPTPHWLTEMTAADDPISKWGQTLDPSVRADLQRQRQGLENGSIRRWSTQVIPATQPKGDTEESWKFSPMSTNGTIVIQQNASTLPTTIQIRTGGGIDSGGDFEPPLSPVMSLQPVGSFAPNNVGLILDDKGDVLVPLYIEKETVGEGIKACVGDGVVLNATFVSSDRQSNLSVFRIPMNAGKAVRISPKQPIEGSLVMLLSPNGGGGARLAVWAGEKADWIAVVATVDGSISGFARGNGQFLAAGSCKPVADQLIRYGQIKRAKLGMLVAQVAPSDPAREQWPLLHNRLALRVQELSPDSAAVKAGLQKGDVILSIADQDVGDPTSLASVLAGRSGTTSLVGLRDGKPLNLKIELTLE